MEGFLPLEWCLFWYLVSLPVVGYGIIQIKKITDKNPEVKPLLAVSGAFVFVLSSLRLPSAVTGSVSHPTGTGLGAILFGPVVTCVLAAIGLIFQSLLLAHGGITTLGANIFSMGIVGPFAAWAIYKGAARAGASTSIAVFFAVFFGSLLTYVVTAIQLSLAFPIPAFEDAFVKFMVIFAYTQVPLAVAEGLLTVVMFDYLMKLRPDILENLKVIDSKVVV
jgi:cobalt/nickel transport system permease protein